MRLFVTISFICLLRCVISQSLNRKFPPLTNLARGKPVLTLPSQGSCGTPSRSVYCVSDAFEQSILCKIKQSCISQCPIRPNLIVNDQYLLKLLMDLPLLKNCLVKDFSNVARKQIHPDWTKSSGESPAWSLNFDGQSNCLRPVEIDKSIDIGLQFTFTTWFWSKDFMERRTLLKKVTSNGEIILSVEISQNDIVVIYRKSINVTDSLVHREPITPSTWVHIAVQVYNLTCSFFINGLNSGYSAARTLNLEDQILDEAGTFYIGDKFSGRLQDMFWFKYALSNREIEEVRIGQFPNVHILSSCRCPGSHPRVNPIDSKYCIPNGVSDTTKDKISRLNEFAHPVEFINDAVYSTYWVSSFLSNISITIDLLDEYQVFSAFINYYSPLPQALVIERQRIDSNDWELWQLYADNCIQRFGLPTNGLINNSTTINCLPLDELSYSQANISFVILSQPPMARPGYNNFYDTSELYYFTRASKMRITMWGHQLVTNPDHLYYGIYNVDINGRCDCHGHATTCTLNTLNKYSCNCGIDSFTTGKMCEKCLPLYNNKPFKIGTPSIAYPCYPCECHKHSTRCIYDRSLDSHPEDHFKGGGGRCLNCKDYTTGVNCELCIDGYFRYENTSLEDSQVCVECLCHGNGVVDNGTTCSLVGGQCPCKNLTTGRTCSECRNGFFNLIGNNAEGCEDCGCDTKGTVDNSISCHSLSGQCSCKKHVRGLKCDSCEPGYYGLNASDTLGCKPCNCDPMGSTSTFCDPVSGQCVCKANVEGRKCDQCVQHHFNFTAGCPACSCNQNSTLPATVCSKDTGQCNCKQFVSGRQCLQCKDGYYKLGSSSNNGCIQCNCDLSGSEPGSICDKWTGTCKCKKNVYESTCNRCYPYAWNLNASNPLGCERCNCDLLGARVSNDGKFFCNSDGSCICMEYRIDKSCATCQQGTYKNTGGKTGCLQCNCHPTGTVAKTWCDQENGQCRCMADFGVSGRACDECSPGYFNFDSKQGSCTECGCNTAGSLSQTCSNEGKCSCKQLVQGDKCDKCAPGSSMLDANNIYGCSKVPTQQGPPTASKVGSDFLELKWNPPDQPNGNIINYLLYNEEKLLTQIAGSSSELAFNHTGLSPYTDYQYRIVSSNSAGEASSSNVILRTASSKPDGSMILKVSDVTAMSVKVQWNQPGENNGPIVNYTVQSTTLSDPDFLQLHWTGIGSSVLVNNLVPYTTYFFYSQACTLGGCIKSQGVKLQTLQAPPAGLLPPTVTALDSSSVMVSWEHPSQPNGVILAYEVWIMQSKGDGTVSRVNLTTGLYDPRPTRDSTETPLEPPATNVKVSNLKSFTLYRFQYSALTRVGKSTSDWTEARSGEAIPLEAGSLITIPINSSYLKVEWSPPDIDKARGVPLNWTLFQVVERNPVLEPFAPPTYHKYINTQSASTEPSVELGPYAPYSKQIFMPRLCNSAGCVNGSLYIGRTEAESPRNQPPPLAVGFNSSSTFVTWKPPLQLNGPDPSYTLERLDISLNYPPPHVTKGVRFPGSIYLRFPSNTIPENVAFTGIEFYFKTSLESSQLFFSASEGRQDEYQAIYLIEGKIYFAFDTQSLVAGTACSRVEISVNDPDVPPLNDNQWHQVRVTRRGSSGSILLDDKYSNSSSTPPSCQAGRIIGTNNGVYFGGLSFSYNLVRDDLKERLPIPRFLGCLRQVKILLDISPEEVWKPIDWSRAEVSDGTRASDDSCPLDLEEGSHMLGIGYIRFPPSQFRGGPEFRISISVRTFQPDGLLIFIYGPETFLLIQIKNYYLEFYVKSIDFSLNITLHVPDICDGAWKKLQFRKSGARLEVTDGNKSNSIGQSVVSMPFSLTSPVYMGGIPKDELNALLFIKGSGLENLIAADYSGCLSNMFSAYRGTTLFTPATGSDMYTSVYLDGCPAIPPDGLIETKKCHTDQAIEVYQGENRNFSDSLNLKPYTDYMYRVTAKNFKGTVIGKWSMGRTQPGVPLLVFPPTSIELIDGFTVTVSWDRPPISSGYIQKYILTAYPEKDEQSTPGISDSTASQQDNITMKEYFADINYNVLNFTTNMTSVTPYTHYTITISACTAGGCTHSNKSDIFLTPTEKPELVRAPIFVSKGAKWLMLRWEKPLLPNGMITGYNLYREEIAAPIYRGGLFQINDTGLQVFSNYRYFIQACTNKGCTFSEKVMFTTGELPPINVQSPKITVLDNHRFFVEWSRPTQMNGIFDRYLLYVLQNPESSIEGNDTIIAYNSTTPYLNYTIDGLTPGRNHFVVLGVCTHGGCALSKESSGKTEESAPEGIVPPNVVSADPQTLTVTWSRPTKPNGEVILYLLYQNDRQVLELNISGGGDSMNLSHRITDLQPWSLHVIYIRACTNKGCGTGPSVNVRTKESAPVGIVTLRGEVIQPRIVRLIWTNPTAPNGRLSFLAIFDGLFYKDPENWDYSTMRTSRTLANTSVYGEYVSIDKLIPFSQYIITAEATNTQGSIRSNTFSANMPPASPDGVKPPDLQVVDHSSIDATWGFVGRFNSVEEPSFQLQYRTKNGKDSWKNVFESNTATTQARISNLEAFSVYEFRLLASNQYGISASSVTEAKTLTGTPGKMLAPSVTNIGQKSVFLAWTPPNPLNGILTNYSIYANNLLVMKVSPSEIFVTISSLKAYTEYEFSIEACNSAACTRSNSALPIRTLTAVPEEIPPPRLTSNSPTSVLALLLPPVSPNGILLSFQLQRRLHQSLGGEVTLRTFKPDEDLRFVDQSSDLEPFTTYEYRSVVQGSGGSGSSEWAPVTTLATVPVGMPAPQVLSLRSTLLEITWSPPERANGRLDKYQILLSNEVPVDIFNISITTTNITNLIPWTYYAVSVRACNFIGCALSPIVIVRTLADVPEDLEPPKAMALSQNYISIAWDFPKRPNGPGKLFELYRYKIAQPLEDNVIDYKKWIRLYNGDKMFYFDRDVTILTTYHYRISFSNDVSRVTSDQSTNVTTFGGQPVKPGSLTGEVIDHVSVRFNWSLPNIRELKGYPEKFLILMNSTAAPTVIREFTKFSRNGVVENLVPNTEYFCYLNVTVTGGAFILSKPEMVITFDGAPSGMGAPRVSVLSASSLRVYFASPTKPNGRITGYYIHLNDERIDTGLTEDGSHLVNGLKPYFVYIIKVEVCTVFSCTVSNATKIATKEATPTEQNPPDLTVLSSTAIRIQWQPPKQDNGVIIRYQLNRRIRGLCRNSTSGQGCIYVLCENSEQLCGSSCFNPKTHICCSAKIYQKKENFACCLDNYIKLPPGYGDDSGLVCCGIAGFVERKNGHECCGDFYLPKLQNRVCCPDLTALKRKERRYNWGFGSSCCGSLSFQYNAVSPDQICCQETLYDKFKHQCCGKKLVSENLVCCANTYAYTSSSDKKCCGGMYVPDNPETLCCQHSATGKSKVHSLATKQIATNKKCCGTELIGRGQACCNSHNFDDGLEVCADRNKNGTQIGCGSGVTCPRLLDQSSYCDQCQVDSSRSDCHVVYMATAMSSAVGSTRCWLDENLVYEGLSLDYTDEDLSPYSEYSYSIVSLNSVGSVTSSFNQARTLSSKPEELSAPRATALRLDVILVQWSPPAVLNSPAVFYVLRRRELINLKQSDGKAKLQEVPGSDQEIYRGDELSFTDSSTIKLFQIYEYSLTACNDLKCSDASKVQVITQESIPSDSYAPNIKALSSTSLSLNWKPPSKPNGFISTYEIYEVSQLNGLIFSSKADRLTYILNDLKPYTNYSFIISSCTIEGCRNSSASSAFTLEDIPKDLNNPVVLVASSTSLQLSWTAPQNPNGKIIHYIIYRSRLPFDNFEKSNLSSEQYTFLLEDLIPGETYRVFVSAFNRYSSVNSSAETVTLPILTPIGLSIPNPVRVLSFDSLFLEWSPPKQNNGPIDQYRIILISSYGDTVLSGKGLATSGTVNGLKPFTLYTVYVSACLGGQTNGCGISAGVSIRTLESIPLDLKAPKVTALDRIAVWINWQEPTFPNGFILQYRINRRIKGDFKIVRVAVLYNYTGFSYRDEDTSLSPYTEYEYNLEAINSVGLVVSNWSVVQTLEEIPGMIADPVVAVLGPFSFSANWSIPKLPNGLIKYYHIFYQQLSNDPTTKYTVQAVIRKKDDLKFAVVSGLKPFTSYRVRLGVENGVGMGYSAWQTLKTEESTPDFVPQMNANSNSFGNMITFTWNAPQTPNGIITEYRIYLLRDNAFNQVFKGLLRAFNYRDLSPYTDYEMVLEACTTLGCSWSPPQIVRTAEIKPSSQMPPAQQEVGPRYVVLKWRKPINANGKILRYEIWRGVSIISNRNKRDINDKKLIYTYAVPSNSEQTEFEYRDLKLEPYMRYSYTVASCNSAGCTFSDPIIVDTLQDAPEQLPQIIIQNIPGIYSKLNLSWYEPLKPNGIIMSYELKRNNSQIAVQSRNSGFTYNHMDENLDPYMWYTYFLVICTQSIDNKCSITNSSSLRTLEAAPAQLKLPRLIVMSSTAIRAEWEPPKILNGIITTYRLFMNGELQYEGSMTFANVDGLKPYTSYVFYLTVCTRGGCSKTNDISTRTQEDLPKNIDPPNLTSPSPSVVEVTWVSPRNPNGLILGYGVIRDGSVIKNMTKDDLFFRNTGLEAGREYTYSISALNSKGEIVSHTVSVTTLSSAPDGIQKPRVAALSATSLQIDWDSPTMPQGDITSYSIMLDGVVLTPEIKPDQAKNFIINYLNPFTNYEVRLKVCNKGGCSFSEATSSTTLEATPSGQTAPILTPLGDSTNSHIGVRIQWARPSNPNGLITNYLVQRTLLTAFSDGTEKNGAIINIYEGEQTETVDNSSSLQPFTKYKYRVTSYNRLPDGVSSDWTTVITKEAIPEGVFRLIIRDVYSRFVRVEIQEPGALRVNGPVLMFNLLINDTKWTSGRQFFYTLSNLSAFSIYSLKLEVCTQPGCRSGEAVIVTTLADTPEGMSLPSTTSSTDNSITVQWSLPANINGYFDRYLLQMRTSSNQIQSLYQGSNTSFLVSGLKPFSAYYFRVLVFNHLRVSENSAWLNVTTNPGLPLLLKSPIFSVNNSFLIIDWSSSFEMNAPNGIFTLWVDNVEILKGTTTMYKHFRKNIEDKHIIKILLDTNYGSVTTGELLFDINSPGYIGSVAVITTAVPQTEIAFYREPWFIAIVSILGAILLAVSIGCLMRLRRSDRSYIRERRPLQPKFIPNTEDLIKGPIIYARNSTLVSGGDRSTGNGTLNKKAIPSNQTSAFNTVGKTTLSRQTNAGSNFGLRILFDENISPNGFARAHDLAPDGIAVTGGNHSEFVNSNFHPDNNYPIFADNDNVNVEASAFELFCEPPSLLFDSVIDSPGDEQFSQFNDAFIDPDFDQILLSDTHI